ncbi:SH3 domain-containing protein [Sphingomicrobium lutaoense]|uniref:SH3-like domain-containing protein n=1 Tax=Sphingomicrobium lutaoense TaxID=515949 RepID=A0A839Z253_9SPHN|nr:SH3 domain-containing protein [Sphingomicrobium lutaoense]MBB3764117.1 SH3-like domain-containing protein [Sphingomicrobium lutaoense]
MMRALALLVAAVLSLALPASAQDRTVPYWASISSGKAMMRTGPGRTYPGVWIYQRRNLPVRVLQRHDNWRKIEGPEGAVGWMAVSLLADRRTGMVIGDAPVNIRLDAEAGSPVRYRAEPGVVGILGECDGSSCRIELGDKEGWIAQDALWGVDKGERFD